MIEVRNITKKFSNQIANNNINLTFDKGLYAIIGKSGSGKSTLLHMIGGLLRPTSGKVFIDGIDIYSLSDKELAKIRNKNIGFVFQSFHLEDTYTSFENVELPLIISKEKYDKKSIDKALERFDVLNKKNEKTINLSGGEKQRVAIARSIIRNPNILLCDEPTGNLDELNGNLVFNYLKELSKDRTVIIVTHNPDLARQCDYVYTLRDGEVV